jgi:hypothetical protein
MRNLVSSSSGDADPLATAAGIGAFGASGRPEPAIARYRRGERVAEEYVETVLDSLPPVPLQPYR